MRIGNKMFCVLSLEPASDHCMSFKCSPEKFAELVEQEGVMPAPYVARYHWVALERFDVLPERELKSLLTTAYELVRDKLQKNSGMGSLRMRQPLQRSPRKSDRHRHRVANSAARRQAYLN
jgi:predicted DNA-binding protein (MmcQ/YjbR family)